MLTTEEVGDCDNADMSALEEDGATINFLVLSEKESYVSSYSAVLFFGRNFFFMEQWLLLIACICQSKLLCSYFMQFILPNVEMRHDFEGVRQYVIFLFLLLTP